MVKTKHKKVRLLFSILPPIFVNIKGNYYCGLNNQKECDYDLGHSCLAFNKVRPYGRRLKQCLDAFKG